MRTFLLPRLLAGTGLVALVAAPVLSYGIVPAQAKLPSDTDITRQYQGTFQALLNASALSGGSGPTLLTNVPASITKHVTVEGTDGNRAVVRDANVVTAGGTEVATSTVDYSVNRKDLTGADGGGLEGDLTRPTGQTVSWPIGTERQDYQYFIQDTGVAVPAVYTGEAGKGGLSTYVFTATAAPAPIVDENVLSALPPALPKATLTALAGDLDLSAAQSAALGPLLKALPDPVPLSYTYAGTTTVYVEPETGLVIASERSETRSVSIAASAATPAVPLTPVWALDFASTDASIADAAADANELLDAKQLFGTTIPLILLALGLALVAAAAALLARGRRPQKGDSADSVEQSDVRTGIDGGFGRSVPTARRSVDEATTVDNE